MPSMFPKKWVKHEWGECVYYRSILRRYCWNGFAAIDYVNPDAIEYAYRLQGLEEEWNEAGNNTNMTI